MHRSLVAAGLIAASAIVVFAAVPLRVSSTTTADGSPSARPRADAPRLQPGQSGVSRAASGTIAGEVRDTQGSPVAGAVVDAVHNGGNWRALALTDRGGRFSLAGVPRGEIELTVRLDTLQFTQVVTAGAGPTTVVLRAPGEAVRQPAGPMPSSVGIAPGPSADRARMASEVLAVSPAAAMPMRPHEVPPTSMDAYAKLDPSGFRRTSEAPLSTFSVDVDTASTASCSPPTAISTWA